MRPIDDVHAPPPPWLARALGHLRLGRVGGLSHLADRRMAAALLVALELDWPEPTVVEAMGAVALSWAHKDRALTLTVRGGRVYGGLATFPHSTAGELAPRGRIAQVRELVAWVRNLDCDGTTKGE